MNRVDGKVALISGAARGIGAESAKRLAKAGAAVVLTDLLEAQGRETAAAIQADGGQALFLRHDVTIEAEWQAVVGKTVETFGGLNVLVNNAGIYMQRNIDEMTLEEWRRLSAVNLDGVFLGTKHGARAMRETAAKSGVWGSIVNLSSVAGLVGSPFVTAYNMSKGGVRLFTKGAALEYAALGWQIRVNSVHPGLIRTDMGGQVFDKFRATGTPEADVLPTATAMHPIGRLGEAMDVAKAILFLASEDSAFMTGSELVVDGGITAR